MPSTKITSAGIEIVEDCDGHEEVDPVAAELTNLQVKLSALEGAIDNNSDAVDKNASAADIQAQFNALTALVNSLAKKSGDAEKSLVADYKAKLQAIAETPTIKMSSLSYANAAGRVGFDYDNYYNDFTNEGHMYPVHGVGDIDTTDGLMSSFVKSSQGEAFPITDLGIDIKVTDEELMTKNAFFDFHNIPTKHLDGSAKLPDGTRVEQRIPYFNPKAESDFAADDLMKVNWINGNAKFISANNSFGFDTSKEFSTTLTSTRVTPQMDQDEYFGLTFFMDGKQSRLTNGGTVSNWRYVSPGYNVDIAWFVAKAMVPCAATDAGAELVETTSGTSVYARPRTAAETEDLGSISYGKNRIMKTVSKSVIITNGNDKNQAFNQRYGQKRVDFGDIILKDVDSAAYTGADDDALWAKVHAVYNKWVGDVAPHLAEKQFAFHEMLKVIVEELGDDLKGPYQYVAENGRADSVLSAFKAHYLREDTYNISVTALATKAQLPPSYMPTPVGETGWMVVPEDAELVVPDDDGEYFIGWSILNQPQNSDVANGENPTNGEKEAQIRWAQTHGYAVAQGPGIIFLTGGDFPHCGTQEPYILEANSVPSQRAGESDDAYILRKRNQLPTVHWRLDKQEVILKSLELGAYTEANVGAGQKMLASIGTKTPIEKESRSKNFLGRYYQELLADPAKIQALVGKTPEANEVYEVVSGTTTFIYGEEQQGQQTATYQSSYSN